MATLRLCLTLAFLASATGADAAGPELFRLSGDLERVHDPVIAQEGITYYLFSTNRGPDGHIPIRCSTDLHTWTSCGAVFPKLPDWVNRYIPGARSLWAPDISKFNGKYCLYYSASTFGKNRSAIGLATNETLDTKSPNYRWIDHGPVMQSYFENDFNCIDPNLVVDSQGQPWLVFGSFWSGIKMRRIDPLTGLLSPEDKRLYSLASRPRAPRRPNAIEAPFIVRDAGYYYLFVSFDFCCRGANSTYKIAVGKSREVTGPYLDRNGKPLLDGGGTPVIAGSQTWRGPGHPGFLVRPDADLMVFHAYNGISGVSALQISTIEWTDGWPRVAPLP